MLRFQRVRNISRQCACKVDWTRTLSLCPLERSFHPSLSHGKHTLRFCLRARPMGRQEGSKRDRFLVTAMESYGMVQQTPKAARAAIPDARIAKEIRTFTVGGFERDTLTFRKCAPCPLLGRAWSASAGTTFGTRTITVGKWYGVDQSQCHRATCIVEYDGGTVQALSPEKSSRSASSPSRVRDQNPTIRLAVGISRFQIYG